MSPRTDIMQGTLDLMVLRTLDTMGPLHGWGIADRIQEHSKQVLSVGEGSLYPALYRLAARGWVESEWGQSDNNRKAKFYAITRSGRKQLSAQTQNWERISLVMMRMLRLTQR